MDGCAGEHADLDSEGEYRCKGICVGGAVTNAVDEYVQIGRQVIDSCLGRSVGSHVWGIVDIVNRCDVDDAV